MLDLICAKCSHRSMACNSILALLEASEDQETLEDEEVEGVTVADAGLCQCLSRSWVLPQAAWQGLQQMCSLR